MDQEVIEGPTSLTSGRMTGRIEVIARVSGRRFWTVEQKLAMLRDAFGPGGSVRSAMERHDVIPTSVEADSRRGFPKRRKSESMAACWRVRPWVQRSDCGTTLTGRP